jgi:hypothetical protein
MTERWVDNRGETEAGILPSTKNGPVPKNRPTVPRDVFTGSKST